MKTIKFNKDLKFGVSTSATQIEGGDTNNTWYRWTKNGDVTKDGSSCFKANNHWNKYKEHIDLMDKLNIKYYRFGLEWARINPKINVFDEKAINHYIDEIKYMKSKGIEPLVTLHHFSNPIWFDDIGGFKKKKNDKYFIEYVNYVANKLKGLVNEWITINEPNIYATHCFYFGRWVNQEKSMRSCLKVMRAMVRCHITSYKLLHNIDPNCKVGVANALSTMLPCGKGLFARIDKWAYERFFNLALCTAMCTGKCKLPLGIKPKTGKYYDFFGINHYTTQIVKHFKTHEMPNTPRNDFNWGIYPEGFRMLLNQYHKLYGGDIYITENGTADKNDAFRPQFIHDFLMQFADLDYVKRYYHWTFMDNFEWQAGQSMCFGLIKYNYDNDTYEIRKSAELYSEIIKNHELNESMMKKYKLKDHI